MGAIQKYELRIFFKEDRKFGKILNIREDSEKMYSYSSGAKDFIHFGTWAGKCLLKNEEQNF